MIAPMSTSPVRCKYLREPSLGFAAGRLHVSPKHGLDAWGPRGLGSGFFHPATIRLGFVGTSDSIAQARAWLHSCEGGVAGDVKNHAFPGFSADLGFFSQLLMEPSTDALLTRHELAAVRDESRKRGRFERAKAIVAEKLQHFAENEPRCDCVILALPDELLNECHVVEYSEPGVGRVHRDFRREIKVEAMRLHVVTQILREKTTRAKPGAKGVDHKSQVAWNFFTALFYKAGGVPWVPTTLTDGTCYVGISFFHPRDGSSSELRASVAQAFNESGDGIVLRGQPFLWDEVKHGRSPHLDADSAKRLIDLTVHRYTAELKHAPSRVVVFKSSKFWEAEREGFEQALSGVPMFDLVSLVPRDDIRLLRVGKYPVLRGTLLTLGELSLLYTTGYIPELGAYPHGHIPSPLQLSDHYGDGSVEGLSAEILALSKLNWNSAMFAGLFPIPLRFARRIGDVLREVPSGMEPLPLFKYYI